MNFYFLGRICVAFLNVLVLVGINHAALASNAEFASDDSIHAGEGKNPGQKSKSQVIYTLSSDADLSEATLSEKVEILVVDNGTLPESVPHLKDPFLDREISVKRIIGGSRYVTALDVREDEPVIESAHVKIAAMSIFGKSNRPSLKLPLKKPSVLRSESVRLPKLLPRVYRDAEKLDATDN